jgi:hypothetical protein
MPRRVFDRILWLCLPACFPGFAIVVERGIVVLVAERLSAFIGEEDRRDTDVGVGGCLLRYG